MLNLICLAAALSCQNPLNPRLVPAGRSGSFVMAQDTLLAGRDTYISKALPNQNGQGTGIALRRASTTCRFPGKIWRSGRVPAAYAGR